MERKKYLISPVEEKGVLFLDEALAIVFCKDNDYYELFQQTAPAKRIFLVNKYLAELIDRMYQTDDFSLYGIRVEQLTFLLGDKRRELVEKVTEKIRVQMAIDATCREQNHNFSSFYHRSWKEFDPSKGVNGRTVWKETWTRSCWRCGFVDCRCEKPKEYRKQRRGKQARERMILAGTSRFI